MDRRRLWSPHNAEGNGHFSNAAATMSATMATNVSPDPSSATSPKFTHSRTQLAIWHRLIPSPTDQNPWAHRRNPMDMMRQG